MRESGIGRIEMRGSLVSRHGVSWRLPQGAAAAAAAAERVRVVMH